MPPSSSSQEESQLGGTEGPLGSREETFTPVSVSLFRVRAGAQL